MTRKTMEGVNVRLTPKFRQQLTYVARLEQRTLRQFIRNVLRSEMAERGYLNYTNVPEPLLKRGAVHGQRS